MASAICHGQEGGQRGKKKEGAGGGDRRKQEGVAAVFLTKVPEYKGNVILGRPTDKSITLSVLMHSDLKIRIAYGKAGKELSSQTGLFDLKSGYPLEIALGGLSADTAYEYRVVDAVTGKQVLPEEGNGSFRTCRAQGSSFVFTMQADSHLDENTSPEIYAASLRNALVDKPDLMIDLGDTFMTGKHKSRETATLHYAAQRYYFGLAGHSVPVFLVLGNHDGEETFRPEFTGADGLATWSCLQRKQFFPNPAPDAFYTGNAEKNPDAGLLQNYYAWTWGDALFVVLDPYWTSHGNRGGKDPWGMTIGKNQYDWLDSTLRGSKAKFKFIFIHQLTGGLDKAGRGGAEAASLFEWGGQEKDGTNTFAANRPGWNKPIHNLLVETGVSAVFHGHDHFFDHQELDGIVYQLVPQPGHRGEGSVRDAENYGYLKGDAKPGSGYLRVSISSTNATVDFVQAQQQPGGKVTFTYKIQAKEGSKR